MGSTSNRSFPGSPIILLACIGLSTAALSQGTGDNNIIPQEYVQRLQAKATDLRFILDYDQPPKPVKIAAARYPRGTESHHAEDLVTIMLAIDAQGRVRDPEVLAGVTPLHEAALACVKGWRFKPAQRGGLPVGTVVVAPVMFLMTP